MKDKTNKQTSVFIVRFHKIVCIKHSILVLGAFRRFELSTFGDSFSLSLSLSLHMYYTIRMGFKLKISHHYVNASGHNIHNTDTCNVLPSTAPNKIPDSILSLFHSLAFRAVPTYTIHHIDLMGYRTHIISCCINMFYRCFFFPQVLPIHSHFITFYSNWWRECWCVSTKKFK